MASQAKDRHSAQLARTLADFNKTMAHTANLLDQFAVDLDAMRTLSAIHVAQCVVFLIIGALPTAFQIHDCCFRCRYL